MLLLSMTTNVYACMPSSNLCGGPTPRPGNRDQWDAQISDADMMAILKLKRSPAPIISMNIQTTTALRLYETGA